MSQTYKPGVIGKDSDYRLYSDIKYLKGIDRKVVDGTITERLIFDKGEIVIISAYGNLEVYAIKGHPGSKTSVTHRLPAKAIRRGVAPEVALSNAKSNIFSRLRYFDKIREMKEYQISAMSKQAQFIPSDLEEIVRVNPKELEMIEGIEVMGIAS